MVIGFYTLKRNVLLYCVFLFVFACFSSCIIRNYSLFQDKGAVETTKESSVITSYLIKPQDLLEIRNLQNEKYIVNEPGTSVTSGGARNGQTYQVEDDGTVGLPMFGYVKVAGITRIEAAKYLEALYRKELKDPIIALRIVNLKVTLLGEINSQGVYSLVKDRTSLIDVIGEGGGLTKQASSENVKIIRGDNKNRQVMVFDLSDVHTLSDPRIILQNGDVIYIAQNKRAERSNKLQSMSSILQPIVVLLNTALIIYTLIH